MSTQTFKPILDPYKTIGIFVNGPVAVSKTHPFSIAASCNTSFKIYSQSLAMKMVSAVFSSPIKAIHIYNEYTYVIAGTQLTKIRYHHVVKQWELSKLIQRANHKNKNKDKDHSNMLVFDGVVIVSIGSSIFVIDQKIQQDLQQDNNAIEIMNLGINILQIVHPVTYVNKLLAYSHQKIILVNPISQKILFQYSQLTNQILAQNKKINLVCPSPLVDIVAVCLDSGQIVIINIRVSKIVFTMKQKRMVTAIGFSSSDSFMATGDQIGNIILWDLQNKKIVYRLQSAFSYPVTSLFFVPGYSLLTATSNKSNSIKQFRINLDDNKTLLQFRERSGCVSINPILSLKCQNNKQITFSTKDTTVFSSLYSHSNMYSLPFCIDSKLPYHLTTRNFSIQVYKERTVIGRLNIKQNVEIGKFSISKKFIIIGTKTRLIKVAVPSSSNPSSTSTILHITLQWKINDSLQLSIYKQQYIYVLCFDSILVLNFNQATLLTSINEGQNCYNMISNLSENMIAFQNRTKQTIQIWDMRSINICREFSKVKNKANCSRLCFSSDNKYLLSAHIDQTLLVWSILQSNLYKTIQLQARIVDMNFTPDNSYFLSIFQGGKQINIWHNYIGKITTTQTQNQIYKFQTSINYLCDDYRQKLNQQKQQFNTEILNNEIQSFDSLLDQIQDANDLNTQNYNFDKVSKWMPLVYYDQIKNRNSILNKNQQVPSLPFFLDFKNLTQQQNKIKAQMRQQAKNKKNKQKQKIDAQLSQNLHQIALDENSTEQEYQKTWNTLTQLSVAETDYQLRRYLLLPGNSQYLLKMFLYVLSKKQDQSLNLMLINILITRTFDIIGSELCSENLKNLGAEILQKIQNIISAQEDIICRCVAVASQNS